MHLSPQVMSAWAKSGRYDAENNLWLPLWLHLCDCGEVGSTLAQEWVAPTILTLIESEFANSTTGLEPTEEFRHLTRFTCASHDIGKLTPAFSTKVKDLDDEMTEAGLKHQQILPEDQRIAPHSLNGHLIFQNWLMDRHNWEFGSASSLASVIGAHHGIPPVSGSINRLEEHPKLLGTGPWHDAQVELLEFIAQRTGVTDLLPHWAERTWSQPFLVILSGLVIVSDWLASTEDYFPLIHRGTYGEEFLDPSRHISRTQHAIAKIQIAPPWHPHDDGLEADDLLETRFDLPNGARATDIQKHALNIARKIDLPGLVIIEESTGGGKTEAALMAAEILAARTGRAGILFALPTQTTTDALFSRALKWLEKIEESYSQSGETTLFTVELLHGRKWLNDAARTLRLRGYEVRDRLLGALGGDSDTDSVSIRPGEIGWDEESPNRDSSFFSHKTSHSDIVTMDWFAGKKKSILADFVTTTVDHLLFGALRSPHLAMRHLGLARKVVIVDEVHSYSSYMNEYLDRALTWLASYNVPVILLSATLSEARCNALISAYRRGLSITRDNGSDIPPVSTPFPCIVAANHSSVEIIETSSVNRPPVHVHQLPDKPLVTLVEDLIDENGCVLIVRNTVRRAQETYEELREVFGDIVSLNHARFTVGDRLANDAELLRRYGPPRTQPDRPVRSIVVSTQVVEQSLDVDFDVLITDLAPIDLILQRLGRLHRHNRPRPMKLAAPTCFIEGIPAADSQPEFERGSQAVYGAHDLLLTAAALNSMIQTTGTITVPQDVHGLIESVYGESPKVPTAWQDEYRKALGQWRTETIQKEQSAQAFLLQEPCSADSFDSSLVDWLSAVAVADEEKGRALVRDGGDSLEVILIEFHQIGGQTEFRILSTSSLEPGRIIPTDLVPDRETIRAMMMSTVRLPARFTRPNTFDKVLTELELKCYVDAWQNAPQLRGQLVLPLIDGKAELDGVTLEYSSTTGLKEVQSQ
ncbi:CRISPR-associated helicase Cas3' [Schaalia sp. ZJ1691]|uniref:CRISPR-associated helicase Cas3' n=1 Tax=Schaalia sp. ZJ1691 TaxID=2709404 RepID=UPI0013ECA8F8|nr:CRISPR-associated helicase Cas3' [Schaalia sp. ZJ1691]